MAAEAEATTSFSYTGTIEQWTAPATAIYEFELRGARGGNNANQFGGGAASGGRGAIVTAQFRIAQGATYNIVVGQNGAFGFNGGGGGGGTFIYGQSGLPLVVAGGGGGSFGRNGGNALLLGGTGLGGQALESGAGGAGWNGAGANNAVARGGSSRPGWQGGAGTVFLTQFGSYGTGGDGGFGGGGGAGSGDGGGGGGFTGGHSGFATYSYYTGFYFGPSQGGTSYVASWGQAVSVATGSTEGHVGITAIAAVPEPESWALLVAGFAAMGGVLRARRVKPGATLAPG